MTQNPVFLSHPTSNLKASPVGSGSRARPLSALLSTPHPHSWSNLNTDQLASNPPPTGYSQHGRQSGPLRGGQITLLLCLKPSQGPPSYSEKGPGSCRSWDPVPSPLPVPLWPRRLTPPHPCLLPGLRPPRGSSGVPDPCPPCGSEPAVPSALDALPPAVCMANSLRRKVFVQTSPSQWDKLSTLWKTACSSTRTPATSAKPSTYLLRSCATLLPRLNVSSTHTAISLSCPRMRPEYPAHAGGCAISEAKRAHAASTGTPSSPPRAG